MARKKLTLKKKPKRAPPAKLKNTKNANAKGGHDASFQQRMEIRVLAALVLQFVRLWSLWDALRIWLCVGPKDLKKS